MTARILAVAEGNPLFIEQLLAAALEREGPRVEPYVELSQLGYVLVVDYGLAGALPQPVPMAPRPGRRSRGEGPPAPGPSRLPIADGSVR